MVEKKTGVAKRRRSITERSCIVWGAWILDSICAREGMKFEVSG